MDLIYTPRIYRAFNEIAWHLERFCELVDALPPPARATWDAAEARVLDVGLQSGPAERALRWSAPTCLLMRMARIDADLAVTISPQTPDEE